MQRRRRRRHRQYGDVGVHAVVTSADVAASRRIRRGQSRGADRCRRRVGTAPDRRAGQVQRARVAIVARRGELSRLPLFNRVAGRRDRDGLQRRRRRRAEIHDGIDQIRLRFLIVVVIHDHQLEQVDIGCSDEIGHIPGIDGLVPLRSAHRNRATARPFHGCAGPARADAPLQRARRKTAFFMMLDEDLRAGDDRSRRQREIGEFIGIVIARFRFPAVVVAAQQDVHFVILDQRFVVFFVEPVHDRQRYLLWRRRQRRSDRRNRGTPQRLIRGRVNGAHLVKVICRRRQPGVGIGQAADGRYEHVVAIDVVADHAHIIR